MCYDLEKKGQRKKKSMWINNTLVVRDATQICKLKTTCNGLGNKWLILHYEDDDSGMCESGRCDHELYFFMKHSMCRL